MKTIKKEILKLGDRVIKDEKNWIFGSQDRRFSKSKEDIFLGTVIATDGERESWSLVTWDFGDEAAYKSVHLRVVVSHIQEELDV